MYKILWPWPLKVLFYWTWSVLLSCPFSHNAHIPAWCFSNYSWITWNNLAGNWKTDKNYIFLSHNNRFIYSINIYFIIYNCVWQYWGKSSFYHLSWKGQCHEKFCFWFNRNMVLHFFDKPVYWLDGFCFATATNWLCKM